MDENVKQDINFLDRPLWMQTTVKDTTEIIRWEDPDGYRFECAGYVPGKVDMIFLYYLMLESQNKNWSDVLVLSRYAVLNGCSMAVGKYQKDRLKQALETWKRTTISFSGTFYSGKKYHDMEFGVIDDWAARESDNRLEIRFNRRWIEKIKNSEFFKYVSFTQMKTLRSPLALRLYEILVKSFYRRDTWEIGVMKLAGKIPMPEKYPAHVIPKVKAAVKRISEKTDLQVHITVKGSRGDQVFTFTRTEKQKPVQGDLFTTSAPLPLPDDVMQMLPAPDRVTCQKICQDIMVQDGVDGLKFYLAKSAGRKQTDRKNTAGYLKTIFDMDLYADVKAGKQQEKAAAIDELKGYGSDSLRALAAAGNIPAAKILEERKKNEQSTIK
ncbi:MAG: replication initiator protein A [Desulfobacteraceae bacterium]|nr:replication initiator protein A [Desulfobacteraceae bacterium]